MSATSVVDWDDPYRGLPSFGEEHQDLFKGRDREAEELLVLVKRATLTVLYGKSGLGKTSLLHAGLFPRLRASLFFPIPVRLRFDERPLDLVAQIHARVREEAEKWHLDVDGPPEPAPTLWRFFHEAAFWNEKNDLVMPVLVFDQFEEMFTIGRGLGELEPFWVQLGDLAENRVPEVERGAKLPRAYERPACKVLLALREDYLPHLDDERGQLPSVAANRYRLKHMNGLRAYDAVYEPGRRNKIIEPHVTDLVVWSVARSTLPEALKHEDLESLDEVEPALLSLVCQRLNAARRKAGAPAITPELIVPGHKEVLERFYQESIEDLPHGVRRFVEEKLLTEAGFRTPYDRDEAEKQPEVTRKAIDALIDRRLLRVEHYVGRPHIEIVHDVVARIVADRRADRLQPQAPRLVYVERPAGKPVFVAMVTDDLEEREAELRSYLNQAGLEVLPSPQPRYPTTNLAEYEAAVLRDLEGCCLFAQILSALPGRELAFAPGKRLPALQHELALRAGTPVLQWRERDQGLDVKDPEHRALLEGARACGIEEFKRTVVERAHPPSPPPSAPRAVAVFVNADARDRGLAREISMALADFGVDCYQLPENGSPADMRVALEANLRGCDGLILVYGKTEFYWVQEQLRMARKIASIRDRPLLTMAVFVGPPPDKPEIPMTIKNVVMLDCRKGLDPEKLRQFVDHLLSETEQDATSNSR